MHVFHGDNMDADEVKMISYAMKAADIKNGFVAFGFDVSDEQFIKFLKAVDKRTGWKRDEKEYDAYLNQCEIVIYTKGDEYGV